MYDKSLLHAAFEEASDNKPTLTALFYQNQTMSYQELEDRSNQLANFLINQGIKVGSIVGIYISPCFEQIIATLAILKTGAAYLPLDPSYPTERIDYMLQDSNTSILLTNLSHSISSDNVRIIDINEHVDQLKDYPKTRPSIDIPSSTLAYIIYTSGSTGTPKGVMIEHQQVCNTVNQMNDIFSLTSSDKILLNVPISFDPSVWMIFWTLAQNAGIILTENQKDPVYLCQEIKKHKLRLFHAGPTLYRMLLNQSTRTQCDSLELIIGGGEAWKTSDLKMLKEILPNCELCNVYGPTEASIHVTYWKSNHNPIEELKEIPIGKPINNMQVWILDENLNQLSTNQIGEIYLSGLGISRGYLNQPQLTQKAFLSYKVNGERIYKTGDLGKKDSDGNIYFMGRVDDQVKLRGFRIELTEIETHILQTGLVKNVNVIICQEPYGTDKLVAFIVPLEKQDYELEIHNHLKNKLPKFMLPKYIFLNEMPVTANQKIDKNKLIEIYHQKQFDLLNTANPQLKIEDDKSESFELLKKLWNDTLQSNETSCDQHFFDMGGDSLSALELAGKISQQFKLEVSVTAIFEHPTLKKMYEFISTKFPQYKEQKTKEQFTDKNETWPLSDNQIWLLHMAKGSQSINNIVMPFKINMAIDEKIMEKAAKILIEEQPLLGANILNDETHGYYIIINNVNKIFFSYTDLSLFDDIKQQEILTAEEEGLNKKQIDIEQDFLFHIKLFKCSASCAYMYIYMHHLISDPFSGNYVFSQLMHNYVNYNNISSKTVSLFTDYIDYELSLKKQSAYQKNLESLAALLKNKNFLINFQKKSSDLSAGFMEIDFPLALVKSLKTQIKNLKVTPFVFFLSILKICLYKQFKQEQFGVGLNVTRRDNPKWEQMIGPLSEQTISLIDFSKVNNFNNLLQITQENVNTILTSPVTLANLHREKNSEFNNEDFFNVLFDFEKISNDITSNKFDHTALPVKATNEIRRYLTIRISEKENKTQLQIRYRKKIFDEQEIRSLAKNYFDFSEKIVQNELVIIRN